MKLGVEIVARIKFKSDRVLRKKSWLTRRSRKIENVTFYKGIYIYIYVDFDFVLFFLLFVIYWTNSLELKYFKSIVMKK